MLGFNIVRPLFHWFVSLIRRVSTTSSICIYFFSLSEIFDGLANEININSTLMTRVNTTRPLKSDEKR